MTNQTWEQATSSPYVEFENGKPKKLVIQHWVNTEKEYDKKDKAGNVIGKEVRGTFMANVISEDDKPVNNKLLQTTSRRFKIALRPILENINPAAEVKLIVIASGEGNQRQFAVMLG